MTVSLPTLSTASFLGDADWLFRTDRPKLNQDDFKRRLRPSNMLFFFVDLTLTFSLTRSFVVSYLLSQLGFDHGHIFVLMDVF